MRRPGVPRLSVEVLEEEGWVQGDNRLGLRIFSTGQRLRSLVVYLELTAPSGVRLRREQRLQLPGGVASRFDLEFRAEEPGIHRARLRFYDLEQGVLVHQVEDLRLIVRPRWTFTQDRSYYTGEREIRFRAQWNREDQTGKRVRVALRGNGVAVSPLGLVFLGDRVEGGFPAATLPDGHYALTALLYGGSGVEDSLTVAFDKRPPAAHEVKIDRFSQGLLVDGEPFFPIGLYWLQAGDLGEIKRLGFNSGDYFYKLQGEEVAELMDAAGAEGVRILLELSDLIRRRTAPDFAAIEERVERYRRHPALLAWYIVDEPADADVDAAALREVYQRIRALDPYHPVYLVNNRPRTYAEYLDSSDILAIDVYPVPRYPLTRVRESMRSARWASLGEKPVWLVAQAFGGVEHWPRSPTPVELRNMVYQGLVQGARGMLFYRYCQAEERHIQPPALWREVRTLAGELKELAPVLSAPGREKSFGAGRDVDVLLKEYRGAYYLFVVNLSRSPRHVRFSLSGLPPMDGIEVLHRSRKPLLQNGWFEADIEPLGTGVYRLETTGI